MKANRTLRQENSQSFSISFFFFLFSFFFFCVGRGPLRAKRSPLSHLPIRPPCVAAALNQSKRLSSPQASALEHANSTPIHLRPSSPPLRNASRTRAPASLEGKYFNSFVAVSWFC